MSNIMMDLRKEYKDDVQVNRYIHQGLTEQIIIKFNNNFGVSIVDMEFSNGIEIAPIKFKGLDPTNFDVIDEPFKEVVRVGEAIKIINSVKALAFEY